MTHRGPFQPLLFCDSVILWFRLTHMFFWEGDRKWSCLFIWALYTQIKNQVTQGSFHMNENKGKSNSTHIILEISSIVGGISTLVRKFRQQPLTLGTLISLVLFLNKMTLANFNLVTLAIFTEWVHPVLKYKFSYFKAIIKKKKCLQKFHCRYFSKEFWVCYSCSGDTSPCWSTVWVFFLYR